MCYHCLPLGGGKKHSKEGGKKKMTMEEIQKLAAASTRDVDLDADADDDEWDEEDLLAELEGAEEETEEGVLCCVVVVVVCGWVSWVCVSMWYGCGGGGRVCVCGCVRIV